MERRPGEGNDTQRDILEASAVWRADRQILLTSVTGPHTPYKTRNEPNIPFKKILVVEQIELNLVWPNYACVVSERRSVTSAIPAIN